MRRKKTDIWKEYLRSCIDIAAENIEAGLRPPYVAAAALDANDELIYQGRRGFAPFTESITKNRPLIHAEREVLGHTNSAGLDVHTIVSTLEPCMPQEDDPKVQCCADLIIEMGVQRVVYGMRDGFFAHRNALTPTQHLRQSGVKVVYLEGFESEIGKRLMHPLERKIIVDMGRNGVPRNGKRIEIGRIEGLDRFRNTP